jgi:Putative bacterial sensory transduction regulator
MRLPISNSIAIAREKRRRLGKAAGGKPVAALGPIIGRLLAASPALAIDPDPCGADMVCASNPDSVVKALQSRDYRAQLTESQGSGDPLIVSGVEGYQFFVLLTGCEQHKKCGTLEFFLEPSVDKPTPALANKLNNHISFIQAMVGDDNTLSVAMYVATGGGLNQRNFTDVLGNWSGVVEAVSEALTK